MPAASTLVVTDKISDPLMPELDPSLLDFRPRETKFGSKNDDPLIWNSQIHSEPSIEIGRAAPNRDERDEFDEDDMNIDLDLDLGLEDDPSIELGRYANPNLSVQDDFTTDLDHRLNPKDVYLAETASTRHSSLVPSLMEDRDDQSPADGKTLQEDGDENMFPIFEDIAGAVAADPRLLRDSQSPLSSAPSRFDNQQRGRDDTSLHQATHKSKKRKVLQSDTVTMLTSQEIKSQQTDRSAILKPISLLSRDPTLFSLVNTQENGNFASRLMYDNHTRGLAPELHGILSISSIRQSKELKRKRDTDIDIMGPNTEARTDIIELQVPDIEGFEGLEDLNADEDVANSRDLHALDAMSNEYLTSAPGNLENTDQIDGGGESGTEVAHFDETTAPLLHPMEQGAVSQSTHHAVHLLRECFDTAEDCNTLPQRKKTILFQQILPELTTTKADATKMFFETLVLATKDAIKIEQAETDVGSDIRIRAKRGLWGAWAEKEAGGEIADEQASVVTTVKDR